MKRALGCILALVALMECAPVSAFGSDEHLPLLQHALIRAIERAYIEEIDVELLEHLSVPQIMARLDRDSSLREVEPSSSEFIRGFEQEGSVSRLTMLSNRIGYLRIGFFGRRTVQDVTKALEGLPLHRCSGLILDVRDNPGGRVEIAIQLAGLFLSKGVFLGHYRGRGIEERYVSNGPGNKTASVIILINRGTASSAELFAGLLRYYHRAQLVGTPTAGKGTVQSAVPLDHRHLLFLTTGRYLFPDGSTVTAAGLQPDAEVHGEDALSKAQSILLDNNAKCGG